MQGLLRKKYRIEVEFPCRFRRSRTIVFKFEQGTMSDLIEMQEEIRSGDLREWIFKFFSEKCESDKKIKWKSVERMNEKSLNKIFDYLLKTYAKGYFSKEKEKTKDQKSNTKENLTPNASLICLVFEKTGETVKNLLDMTWEQVEFLIDGTIWNMNAQTKEGANTNKRNARRKKDKAELSDEDALAKVKEMEQKLPNLKFGNARRRKL